MLIARSKQILIMIVALAPASLLILANQNFGPGLSPDSIGYIASARSLAEMGSYLSVSGEYMVSWPPLYPTLLSIISENRFEIAKYSQFYNATALFMLTYLSAIYVERFTQNFTLALLAATFVATSSPLFYVAMWVWSEILFSLFCLGSLFIFSIYYTNRSKKIFFILIVVSSLAFLQRYAGITLIISICLLFLMEKEEPPFARIRRSVTYGALSALPVLGWLSRNYLSTGSLTGDRRVSMDKLLDATLSVPETVGRWFTPYRFDNEISLSAAGIIIFVLLFSIYLYFTKIKRKNYAIIIVSVFIIIYSIFIIYALSTACCAERFMAPIFPQCIVLLVLAAHLASELIREKNWKLERNKFWPYRYYLLFAICLPFIAVNTVRTFDHVERNIRDGLGFAGRSWIQSEIISELRGARDLSDGLVFSNRPTPVYYYLDLFPVLSVPTHSYWYVGFKRDQMPEFISRVEKEFQPVFVVWFNQELDWFYDIADLERAIPMEIVSKGSDGLTYRISKNK